MKTLYLLRHAKSSWDDPNLSDFDRPLNKRGQKAAPRIGAYLHQEKIKPDLVISSPAVRASQTTELVSAAAGFKTTVRFEPEIYEATPERLLKIVKGIDDAANSAMLVGHNPGFEELLTLLTGESQRMPTAALACLEFKLDKWSDVTASAGKFKSLVKAKDLK
jgi:phosphohistidine phosphatase